MLIDLQQSFMAQKKQNEEKSSKKSQGMKQSASEVTINSMKSNNQKKTVKLIEQIYR